MLKYRAAGHPSVSSDEQRRFARSHVELGATEQSQSFVVRHGQVVKLDVEELTVGASARSAAVVRSVPRALSTSRQAFVPRRDEGSASPKMRRGDGRRRTREGTAADCGPAPRAWKHDPRQVSRRHGDRLEVGRGNRSHRVESGQEACEQRRRVVVALGQQQPANRAIVDRRPLREHRCLSETGRSNDERDTRCCRKVAREGGNVRRARAPGPEGASPRRRARPGEPAVRMWVRPPPATIAARPSTTLASHSRFDGRA